VSLKSLGRKEEPPTNKMSRPNKIEKKVAIEAMVVPSALAEDHVRPCPESTFEVVSIPLDPGCPKSTI